MGNSKEMRKSYHLTAT